MEFMLFNACHTALHSRYYTHVKSHGMVFDQWEVCSVASNRCVDVQLCFCFFTDTYCPIASWSYACFSKGRGRSESKHSDFS